MTRQLFLFKNTRNFRPADKVIIEFTGFAEEIPSS
jgi:hypothetical protein